MSKIIFLHAVISFLACTHGWSQDMHMTYYVANNPFFNPASSGDFVGFIKVGGGIRTQYARTYEQGIINLDANFISPLNEKHWISGGVQYLYDVSGSLNLQQSGGGTHLSYQVPFGKKGKHILGFGINFSLYTLGISTDQYISELTITGNKDPDLLSLQNFGAKAFSVSTGIRYKKIQSKKSSFQTGVAIIHLNRPEFRFLNDPSMLGLRINANAQLSTTVNKQLTILPAVYFSTTEKHNNIMLQLTNEYKINPKHDWAIIGGASYRFNESADLILGYKSKKLMAAISMDILTGKVADIVHNLGAFELCAYYIINKETKPKVVPVIICPRI